MAIEPGVEAPHAPRLLVRLHGEAEVERREVARRGGEEGEQQAAQHLVRVKGRVGLGLGLGLKGLGLELGLGLGIGLGLEDGEQEEAQHLA